MKNKLCAFSSVLALTGILGAPMAAAQSSLPGASFGSSLGSSFGSSHGSSQGSSEGEATQPKEGEGVDSRVLWQESFDEVDTPAWFTHRAPEGWSSNVQGVDSGEARWKG